MVGGSNDKDLVGDSRGSYDKDLTMRGFRVRVP